MRVSLLGNGTLVAGDRFTLFSAPALADSFATVSLPSLGPGLIWTNKTDIDGTIEVIPSGEPTTPPTLTMTRSAASITLSWPIAYTSFVLRGQTNPPAVGLGGNWGIVPGVVANQVTLPLNPADGSVFYQLLQR
jgi:hypothetical protein